MIEDLDSELLGHHLKIWADKYPCTGETKGGHVNLNHRVIIVTSNYSIEHVFRHDDAMREAIASRFKQKEFEPNEHAVRVHSAELEGF